jgi:hypothetical protein
MPHPQHENEMHAARVVARFTTHAGEVQRAGATFTPAISVGSRLGKWGLAGLGFAGGMGWMLSKDLWPPGWVGPASNSLLGFVIGFMAAIATFFVMGRRQRLKMAALAREDDTQHVVVRCGSEGLSWATEHLTHTMSYGAVEQAVVKDNLLLIRHRLFVFYVPERGFATAEDRAFLIRSLQQNVAAEKLSGLMTGQG